uniref:Expressed protein n=1 Tax=Echinococcus granulosus TaxID=6210 RepID=A0A068WGS8_ECHGR|nr:expressed protein [Echinococcus granulosus]
MDPVIREDLGVAVRLSVPFANFDRRWNVPSVQSAAVAQNIEHAEWSRTALIIFPILSLLCLPNGNALKQSNLTQRWLISKSSFDVNFAFVYLVSSLLFNW